ncbi:hypothetical protein SISSUDRAFT_1048214 [Sistotremastrum suecicum HHB10207 ss-3]|uniref:Secreted protein n=1 Tax=Sistotremastrum suecicum HHB10207 ss-3 TaxID=1314776 RepID=A0A166CLM4_9AGAM|nr:hypothetical protein SISSUDRAFT_1048214 [Sistotremastrum suecicum HHB10207 ss-3]
MWSCLFFHLTLFSCILLVTVNDYQCDGTPMRFHLATRVSHLWKFFDWWSSLQLSSSLCDYLHVNYPKTALTYDETEVAH